CSWGSPAAASGGGHARSPGSSPAPKKPRPADSPIRFGRAFRVEKGAPRQALGCCRGVRVIARQMLVPAATATAVTATAAATAATAAAVATTTAAATATAAAAALLRAGFVDGEAAAFDLLAVHLGNRRLRLIVTAHLDEPEPLGSARVPVHDDL